MMTAGLKSSNAALTSPEKRNKGTSSFHSWLRPNTSRRPSVMRPTWCPGLNPKWKSAQPFSLCGVLPVALASSTKDAVYHFDMTSSKAIPRHSSKALAVLHLGKKTISKFFQSLSLTSKCPRYLALKTRNTTARASNGRARIISPTMGDFPPALMWLDCGPSLKEQGPREVGDGHPIKPGSRSHASKAFNSLPLDLQALLLATVLGLAVPQELLFPSKPVLREHSTTAQLPKRLTSSLFPNQGR